MPDDTLDLATAAALTGYPAKQLRKMAVAGRIPGARQTVVSWYITWQIPAEWARTHRNPGRGRPRKEIAGGHTGPRPRLTEEEPA